MIFWKYIIFYVKINSVLKKQTSTIHSLNQITKTINESIGKGCFARGIFLDLKKHLITIFC